jgi:hypothetical protein
VEGVRNLYKMLVGKPEGRRPLGRHKHRREDNIITDFKGKGFLGRLCLTQVDR